VVWADKRMTDQEREQLANDIASGIASANRQENPINPQNIFYAIGAAAVIFVGYSFNQSVEQNSEKLDTLVSAVSQLTSITEQQQQELGKRGMWMSNVDTYSEQSRLKDNEHGREIFSLKEDVKELSATVEKMR
jgi:orotidine-5'-phosphate decarboxylase